MRRKLALFTIIILIISCTDTSREKTILANEIEISLLGELGGRSIKIDKNGIVRKCFYSSPYSSDSPQCYFDSLDNQSIRSINTYLEKIRGSKTENFYDSPCQDCGDCFLQIVFEDTTITTHLIGVNTQKNLAAEFVKFITDNRVYDGTRTDSIFVFPTRKILELSPSVSK